MKQRCRNQAPKRPFAGRTRLLIPNVRETNVHVERPSPMLHAVLPGLAAKTTPINGREKAMPLLGNRLADFLSMKRGLLITMCGVLSIVAANEHQ